MWIMAPLVLFIVVMLLTFIVGCFVVGSVIVEARQNGRPMLPEDPRPEPASAAPDATHSAPSRPRASALAIAVGGPERRHEAAGA